jgi:glutamate dehydrogenase/leucine dehydrogenase
MVVAFNAVLERAHVFDVDLRTAAYLVAVDRIMEARKLRGLYA